MSEGMTSHRIDSLDQFRGFAIASMIAVNGLAAFESVPAWLKHAPDTGFTVADAVAPFFIFAIGLLYPVNFSKGVAKAGLYRTVLRTTRRYALIFLIGFALSATAYLIGLAIHHTAAHPVLGSLFSLDENAAQQMKSYGTWGVLQSIGLSGIAVLPFILLSRPLRAACAGLILLLYDVLLRAVGDSSVLPWPHAGPWGVLGWTAMMLIATCFKVQDLMDRPRRTAAVFFLSSIVLMVAGLGMHPWHPVSKPRVSVSYVFFATGISLWGFLVFWALNDRLGWRIPGLTGMGRNPLLIYILHEPTVGLAIIILGTGVSLSVALSGAAAVTLICILIACELDRRGKYLRL